MDIIKYKPALKVLLITNSPHLLFQLYRCAGGFCYWLVGFGLMYGRGELSNGFFGFGDFFFDLKATDPLMPAVFTYYFYQISFCTTSASIMSGGIAERCKFKAYVMLSFLITLIYSVGGGKFLKIIVFFMNPSILVFIDKGWLWGYHGWLRNIGAIEFSGAGPVHIIGGTAGLVGACYIKPRIGRFDKGPKPPPLSDGVATLSGVFMLWWGWLAFNSGSSFGVTGGKWQLAARAGVATVMASITSGFTGIIYSLLKHKGKVDVGEVANGILAGLGKQKYFDDKSRFNGFFDSCNQLWLLYFFVVLCCGHWSNRCPADIDCRAYY